MRYPHSILVLICAVSCIAMFAHAPIAQDLAYHHFADQRGYLGIANFANVLSNLGFLLLGAWGLARARQLADSSLRMPYALLSGAVLLVGIGSSWYHLAPSNASLLWDRLPISLAFMSLLAMLLQERVWPKINLLWPLLTLGIAAALYWYLSELQGAGDLRPYLLVQFLPMLLLPLLLLLYPARYFSNRHVWLSLLLYLAAKLCEHFDGQILAALPISGHSIKHLLASLAVLAILLALPRTARTISTRPALLPVRHAPLAR